MVKPITNINEFLKRFDNFKDAEFRSIEVVSPTSMQLTFATQDRARDFDWLTIALEFSGISDAKLLDANKLAHIDMQDGITLISKDKGIAFGIGEYKSQTSIIDSVCYILSTSVKYSEGQF